MSNVSKMIMGSQKSHCLKPLQATPSVYLDLKSRNCNGVFDKTKLQNCRLRETPSVRWFNKEL